MKRAQATRYLLGAGLVGLGWLVARLTQAQRTFDSQAVTQSGGSIANPKAGYAKRFLRRPRDVQQELDYLLSNPDKVKAAFRGNRVSPHLRKKIILVVTGVNGCRY